jgi:hypothetical protein
VNIPDIEQHLDEIDGMTPEIEKSEADGERVAKRFFQQLFRLYSRGRRLPMGAHFHYERDAYRGTTTSEPRGLEWEHEGRTYLFEPDYRRIDLQSFATLIDAGFLDEVLADLRHRKESGRKTVSEGRKFLSSVK